MYSKNIYYRTQERKRIMKEKMDISHKNFEEMQYSAHPGVETVTCDDCNQPEEAIQAAAPKILVQRIFYQTEDNQVEQKLEYIIAKSEMEITKHVFGGLFNSRYYAYIPENYCRKHEQNLLEYQNESLPKIGDKFDTLECFRLYIDGNARHWKYYLKCADSHRKNGKDSFVYQCVSAKPRSKVSHAKGIRKRTRKVPQNNCPCRIILKPVPADADELTVVYVCNHHDHPLDDEYFNNLQHGRRIHPRIKEEIMDLLSLDVNREVVKKYIFDLVGYTINNSYFRNVMCFMKRNKIERQFSLEKLKVMSQKIERIKEQLGLTNEKEYCNNPDDITLPLVPQQDTSSQLDEVFNVLNTVSAVKKAPSKRKNPRDPNVHTQIKVKKRQRREISEINPVNVTSTSRLETRLRELKYDEETLQSIKHLQDSVRCEPVKGAWGLDKNSTMSFNRSPPEDISRHSECFKNISSIEPLIQEIQLVDRKDEIFGNSESQDYTQLKNIGYTNVVTVVENNVEPPKYKVYEDTSNNSYCIEYDEVNEQTNEALLLLENLENMPVQVKATELATVNILPKNINQESKNISNEGKVNETEHMQNDTDKPNHSIEIVSDQIEIIEERPDESDIEVSAVLEVLSTNDKKLLPSREFVNSVILNKSVNTPGPEKGKTHDTVFNTAPKVNTNRHSSNIHRKKRKRSGFNGGTSTDATSFKDYELNVKKMENKSQELSNYVTDCVDLDQLEDDECYMIIVNNDNDESSTNEILKKETSVNVEHEWAEVKCNDKIVQCNLLNKAHYKIKGDIHRLHNLKCNLMQDVIFLRNIKKKLFNEMNEAKLLKKLMLCL